MHTGSSDKTAIVLAAGYGSRLGGNASEKAVPKPLLEVEGIPLLGWTLTCLHQAGVTDAVIVVGHQGARVSAAARRLAPNGLRVHCVRNGQYNLKNGVSVLTGVAQREGNFVLTMADHLLSPEIIALALATDPGPDGAVLCIDRKLDTIFDMDDATKVLTDGGTTIEQISKTLPDFDAVDTGVFHCSVGLKRALQAHLDEHGDCSVSDGITQLARTGRMHAADIGDLFWQDVDTPETRAYATEKVRELGLTSRLFPGHDDDVAAWA